MRNVLAWERHMKPCYHQCTIAFTTSLHIVRHDILVCFMLQLVQQNVMLGNDRLLDSPEIQFEELISSIFSSTKAVGLEMHVPALACFYYSLDGTNFNIVTNTWIT